VQALTKIKKFLTSQAVGPTRGPQTKNRKPIGNLGHALDFVAIGKLGNALDFGTIGNLGNDLLFVNIGNLGNDKTIAKIANDFGGGISAGGDGGTQPKIIGNIGKIVMPFKLA